MTEKKIRNIIFDIGNVLLKFDPKAKLQSSVSPMGDNIQMLEDLSKNYHVYAITDSGIEQVKFEVKHFDFYAKFKDVLIAAECNLMKNTPEIYQHFLIKHSLIAEETVFIDDNEENIKAAKKAGIYVICFTSLDSCTENLKNLCVLIG